MSDSTAVLAEQYLRFLQGQGLKPEPVIHVRGKVCKVEDSDNAASYLQKMTCANAKLFAKTHPESERIDISEAPETFVVQYGRRYYKGLLKGERLVWTWDLRDSEGMSRTEAELLIRRLEREFNMPGATLFAAPPQKESSL